MAISFNLTAELRTDAGKGASRRLRRTGKVPAILYGGHQDPVSLSLDQNELQRNLAHEAFYSHILTIQVGKASHQAILKDLQRHPSRAEITHVDLQRVSAGEELRTHVPLHFINEAASIGVKQQGGVISHNMIDVEISCLPKDLPEFIEVDVAALEIGEAIHLSELKLPEGVSIVALAHGADHDSPVVAIHHARVTAEETEAEEGAEEVSPEVEATAQKEEPKE